MLINILAFMIACSTNFKDDSYNQNSDQIPQDDEMEGESDTEIPTDDSDDTGDTQDTQDTTDTQDTQDTEDTQQSDDCIEGPAEVVIPTDPNCEYVPNNSNSPFAVKIEWNFSHEMIDPTSSMSLPAHSFTEHPDMRSIFQAPAVMNATDDDGDGMINNEDIPDIAVVMGNEIIDDGNRDWSVLRLFSGDGSTVFSTIGWEDWNGQLVAPALFSGVAMADIDGDDHIEVVTVVTEEDQLTCHPAAYEVDPASGELSLDKVSTEILFCNDLGSSVHASHAPAVADVDSDGTVEVILGRMLLEGDDLSLRFEGSEGRAWNHAWWHSNGYWNSGFHSFAYDIDGDGSQMEIVAGRSIYNNDGSIYCNLWNGGAEAEDGYPATADVLPSINGPEIVISGNRYVSIFSGIPNSNGQCEIIDIIDNNPLNDGSIYADLMSLHPSCDESRRSFGGQPTIADFNGDGSLEIGVSGACWYTVYKLNSSNQFYRYAMYPTRDWSSASTGSTVFDFNGDGASEVIFSDEDATYVWGIDTNTGLQPWERFFVYLEDENHKSWTIHEYPLVADVDGDGKAEILAVNSESPTYPDHYGIYLIGAADDNWVSARPTWNQHAYYITNIDSSGQVGYGSPNYAPYTASDFNNFRQQAPGSFGAMAAANLFVEAEPPCQMECGDITLWLQIGNEGQHITANSGLILSVYGVGGGQRTLLASEALPWSITPGQLSEGYAIILSNWGSYESLVAVIDDPEFGPESWGASKECDEADNEVEISLDDVCP